MKRHVVAVLAALLLTAVPLSASAASSKPKPPKPPAVVAKPVKVTAVKPVHAVKAPKPSQTKVKAVKAVKPIKPVKAAKPATTAKSAKAAKTTTTKSAKADKKKSSTATAANTPAETTGTPTNDAVPLTKVQEKLKRNTNLAAKLEGRLPAGTDLMKAALGFKNLGQFVAAVNVSNNHNIPFVKLKTLMVTEGYSLGQAMQQLKPSSAGTVEAQRAEIDAQRTIAATESQTTTTATVKSKPKKSARKAVRTEL